MTETVMPPDLLELLRPEWAVPLVAVLVHPTNTQESGSIFEVGGGHIAKLRWQRAKGGLLKTDHTMTPGAVLKKWKNIEDFSEPSYPTGPANFMELLEEAQKLGSNDTGEQLDFKGKVALITGAGGGQVLHCNYLCTKLTSTVLADPTPYCLPNMVRQSWSMT